MLRVWRPPPPWQAWVECAVAVQPAAQLRVARFPALPQAMLTLQLAAMPGQPASAAVPGPVRLHTLSTVATAHATPPGLRALGLVLHPATAAVLLGRSCGVQIDQVLDWQHLAGLAEAERLQQCLAACRSDAQRLHALLASLGRVLAQGSALATLQTDPRVARITRLVEAVGRHGTAAAGVLAMGPRQLQRSSLACLGVTPKQFQQLVRFRQALSQALRDTTLPGADLAQDGGFYDQSHLARSARRLAGQPLQALRAAAQGPSEWWALQAHRQLHAPGAPQLAALA